MRPSSNRFDKMRDPNVVVTLKKAWIDAETVASADCYLSPKISEFTDRVNSTTLSPPKSPRYVAFSFSWRLPTSKSFLES